MQVRLTRTVREYCESLEEWDQADVSRALQGLRAPNHNDSVFCVQEEEDLFCFEFLDRIRILYHRDDLLHATIMAVEVLP